MIKFITKINLQCVDPKGNVVLPILGKAWNEDLTLELILTEIKKEMLKAKKCPQPAEFANY